jgi:hypothetical protein
VIDFAPSLEPLLAPAARDWLAEAVPQATRGGEAALGSLLAQAPRRIGRAPLGGGRRCFGDVELDLDAWRACDAAADLLLRGARAKDDAIAGLFAHGDPEERTMLLRHVAARAPSPLVATLIGEAQRTNVTAVFAAAVCDSNVVARARAAGALAQEDVHRVVLKLAFNDLPAARCLGLEAWVTPELTRMLQDFATEREAAGRAVWADTNRLIALAPGPGTLARLIGGLEHGDDRQRLAAAAGLLRLNRPELRPFAAERLPRERHPQIRELLARILDVPPPRP